MVVEPAIKDIDRPDVVPVEDGLSDAVPEV